MPAFHRMNNYIKSKMVIGMAFNLFLYLNPNSNGNRKVTTIVHKK